MHALIESTDSEAIKAIAWDESVWPELLGRKIEPPMVGHWLIGDGLLFFWHPYRGSIWEGHYAALPGAKGRVEFFREGIEWMRGKASFVLGHIKETNAPALSMARKLELRELTRFAGLVLVGKELE
jgi:hypothetical protein